MVEEYPTTDKLVEEIYERLSAFRNASEQIAEYAKQSDALSEHWRTLTVSFSEAAEDTRQGIVSLVNASRVSAESASRAQVDIAQMTSQIQALQLRARLDALAAEQKEVRELVIGLQTRLHDRIRSLDIGLDELRITMRKSLRVVILLQALLLCAIATLLIKTF
jgi:hypothetical protein